MKISGVGRVDLLIGERLVLELDGKEHHTGKNFESDRERDFALTLRGYLVVRLSYAMIMHSWPRIEAGLIELIRRGEHLGVRAVVLSPFVKAHYCRTKSFSTD